MTAAQSKRTWCKCHSCGTKWLSKLWSLTDDDVLISDLGDQLPGDVRFGIRWADCPNADCGASKITEFSMS